MTTDTDKLVETALALGAQPTHLETVKGALGLRATRLELTAEQLAAFASAHIASLCGDVEPVGRLLAAHKESTPGVWQKGQTTHHTVTETGYAIGEFHHANDANFCDVAHELAPAIASTVAALKARATDWQRLYDRAINEANGLTNYVEDRPELRSAERRLDVIYADARALKGQP